MGCSSCGGGVRTEQTQIVTRQDGSTFEVSTPTEAKIKILTGEGKSYVAKKA